MYSSGMAVCKSELFYLSSMGLMCPVIFLDALRVK